MKLIRAIIRPEKVAGVLAELSDAGFPAVTKAEVVGRGKQRGIKVGDISYDEIPKNLLMFVCEDEYKDHVLEVIKRKAKTGEKGAFGDGKIFVSEVEDVYTISSGERKL
ncbi:P-II family nitrogen regulator [Clostridium formicaceticum]|uniref:Nitrogen fixation protein NifHD n=1 Tax=Clostridium formicaceticum TaxID=1497 RepID=A0AAC9RL47_9CLOT|nr:P-II family nitrogen regulator [Clostridium formicaceticum]AOY76603.1 nitrogen fixation protein NifHD [Clostridium formicaceticum]ARE87023.1 Nitrogen regulatory protein P-II [Clostridium formicaceticum]